uniref:Si:ch73-379j16.2 n=1 Tax=Cyprinodon variegatus TaxID=28743 RepID=A0A3Q2GHH7_CYPVA
MNYTTESHENEAALHFLIYVNDHYPMFSEKEQTFEIAEHSSPGTRFQLHAARDPDAGINSISTYTLTSNDHFDIEVIQSDEEKVPFLVLKKSLDREQKNSHVFILTAADGGKPPKSATLNVSIIVLDTNDNRPSFKKDIFQIEIQEDTSIGATLIRLNASDPDEGTNGEIEYSLSKTLTHEVYNVFYLNSVSGEITLKSALDFEDSKTYKLDVQASDKGQPPLTGRCRVIIKIKDVNDNAPEIEVTSLSNSVSEDSKPGTVISLISVTDKDANVNGKVIVQITDQVPFELKHSYKENIYSVVTKAHLDREKEDEYFITIKATDCGEPPLSTVKSLRIQITDVNDNSPVFSKKILQYYVTENNVAGAPIFSLSATDIDVNENAALTYTLVRQNDVTSFLNINSENGQISALKGFDFESPVDYEENQVFKLDIEASDKGMPPLTGECRVIVKVKDVNDNPPEIDVTSLSNTVSEESKPGTVISLISVKDKDSGLNGKIISSIISDVPFELKPSYKAKTYSVVTSGYLDREIISHYEILIKATDCGDPLLSTIKTLNIEVTDVNDNKPKFSQNPINIYLLENNVPGKSIFSVTAADDDLKENAAISYHIARDGNQNGIMSFLSINTDNGEILALKSFDFETLKTFKFQVVATDSGTPSLSSNVTINVFILDQNDNPPVILYPISSNGSTEGVEEIPPTATVILKLVEPKEAFAASDAKSATKDVEDDNVTFYLMITLGVVSFLFIISIIVLIAMQCSKSRDYASKYLQETNYDGTLNASCCC